VIDGILLLSKPAGVTSFQALGAVKRILGTRRIGHAGTLDRFAEGLLLALSGNLTRLCPLVSSLDKEYIARFFFGKGTDTLDPEGAIVSEGTVPAEEAVRAVLPEFIGPIMQVPPEYSAVHVDGRRAYQAARNGERVNLHARQVTVHRLELLEYSPPEATLRIACSKGTYVRSLARDIAARLLTSAFVSRLSRTRIGDFRLDEAVSPGEFVSEKHLIPPLLFFERCPGLKRLTVRDEWIGRVAQGFPPTNAFFPIPPTQDGTYGAFSGTGKLLALFELREGVLRYAAVLSGGAGG
jgi:tRNA pseudouridine55 synthase